MQYINDLDDVFIKKSWVTIGTFDGVHLGHQTIIRNMVKEARAAGTPTAVVTFFPHPVKVLKKIKDPLYLTTPEDRAKLIGYLGVDYVITLNFNQTLAAMSAEDFMKKLHLHLGISSLWVGEDFALGHHREGDIHKLKEIGEREGYFIRITPKIAINNMTISSSNIRNLLRIGEIGKANKLLGRYYSIHGKVVKGDGRGTSLGIPTANLDIWEEQLLPKNGVYATWVWLNHQKLKGASNIGTNPTFIKENINSRVETYILNFHENIYFQELKLDFVKYLRDEKRFSEQEELIDQMHHDVQMTEEVLSNES